MSGYAPTSGAGAGNGEFQAMIQDVTQFELMGRTYWRLTINLTKPIGDEDGIIADIFVSEHVLDGYVPQTDDDVDGIAWFQGIPAWAAPDGSHWKLQNGPWSQQYESLQDIVEFINTLNPRGLRPSLAQNVLYESNSINVHLRGPDAVLAYLVEQLQARRCEKHPRGLVAERAVALAPVTGRPCAALSWGDFLECSSGIFIEIDDGLITKIENEFADGHFRLAKRSGLYTH